MAQGYQALTEKEKQTLRLMLLGHDAKSLARHLDLSVHTVNERLRDARRKLEVSSSREAARLLLQTELENPQSVGDTLLREARSPGAVPQGDASAQGPKAGNRLAWPIAGALIMSLMLAALALSTLPGAEIPSDAAGQAAATVVTGSDAAGAARAWLALGDEERWAEAWRATGQQFRKLNTVERWIQAAEQARVPLGALRSRVLLSQDRVPAPPAGVEVIKFRTDFANKSGVVETVSLAREDGEWKVVGVYLD
jgi:DNA-binding CsgD family transcriptional regulator